MDEYIEAFIDYKSLKRAYPGDIFEFSDELIYSDELIDSIEEHDACAVPVFTIDNRQGAFLDGIRACMRRSVFDYIVGAWLNKDFGSVKTNVIPVSFEIHTKCCNKTQPTVDELIKCDVDVQGYWKDNYKEKELFGWQIRDYYDISELPNEKESVWHLRCEMENSYVFEELFNAQLTVIKKGHLSYPELAWAISKGPRLPKPLDGLISKITLSDI